MINETYNFTFNFTTNIVQHTKSLRWCWAAPIVPLVQIVVINIGATYQ